MPRIGDATDCWVNVLYKAVFESMHNATKTQRSRRSSVDGIIPGAGGKYNQLLKGFVLTVKCLPKTME